ncbi:MAG: glucoamylase family protein [Acholeplasma sp.]
MKKIITIWILIFGALLLVACTNGAESTELTRTESSILALEKRKSFDFFWEQANTIVTDNGYGLIPDRYPTNPSISSIASVGYGLAAYVVGADEGWITFEEGYERADGTLDMLLRLDRVNGFYYHFLNTRTGARAWDSEISIIDTGILLMGAIAAGEYFGDDIQTKVNMIYETVDWNWYLNKSTNLFYMGYSPETGFSGSWDHVSEQLMLYILASGAPVHSVSKQPYETVMAIQKSSYLGTYISEKNPELSVETPFYYTWNGSLFQHQFSHAFIDFNTYQDPDGINWFENARLATLANYAYTQDFSDIYKTYSSNSWGISAGDGPLGYNAFGAKPAKDNRHNGTITPYAAIASINYTPKLAAKAAVYFYQEVEGLFGTYGFKDAFNLGLHDPMLNINLSNHTPWMAEDVIGIDKGITLLMLANYNNQIIWRQILKNDHILAGLTILGFTKNSE